MNDISKTLDSIMCANNCSSILALFILSRGEKDEQYAKSDGYAKSNDVSHTIRSAVL